MEDPWGDPWATDVSVKIDLPAPPREAYFASDRVHSPRRTNPDAASPWHDDDDTWAGWTNARSGRESPAWGSRSPALKPSAAVPERRASPDPWAAAAPPEPVQDNERADQNQTAAGTAGLDIHVEDSASLSQAELSPTRPSDRLTASFDHSGQDIWGKEQASTADGRATASTPEDPHGLEPADTGSRCAAHVETEGRPVAGRQPSKVQELVEMFDVMARRSTSPAGTAVPESKGLSTQGNSRRGSALASPAEPSTARTDASDEVFQSHPTQLPIEDEQGAAEACVEIKLDSTAVPDDPPARTPPYEKKDAPQIPFPIDLSHLDDLFPPGPSPPPESNSRSEGIGSETFTSVSERKVWYRISRFGSMRRHDEGDQDDYVRVGWAKSRVRERTLEVIRRWMEEDSIGGRVALGRRLGSGAGNVFNWDSPGEPVEIGELLKKKPAAYQSRPPSVGGAENSLAPGNAAFGWSSNLPVSTAIAAPHAAPAPRETADDVPSDSRRPSLRNTIALLPEKAAQATSPPQYPPPSPAPAAPDAFDDVADDEWGEMVSASTVPAVSPSFIPFSDDADTDRTSSPNTSPKPSCGTEHDGSDKAGKTDSLTIGGAHWKTASDASDTRTRWFGKADPPLGFGEPAAIQSTALLPDVPDSARNSVSSSPLISDGTAHGVLASVVPAPSRGPAVDGEVVAAILDSLPDLSYMLR